MELTTLTLCRNTYSELKGTGRESITLDLKGASQRQIEATLADLLTKGWFFVRKSARELGRVKLIEGTIKEVA